MKIVVTRKDHPCNFENCCYGRVVKANSISATQKYKADNGFYMLYYHTDCYIQAQTRYVTKGAKIAQEAFEERQRRKNKPKGPMGRPRKYSDPLQARNTKCLISYHSKLGHTDRVGELQVELDKLEESMIS